MDRQSPLKPTPPAGLDFTHRSRARREQTSRDLAALRKNICDWIASKRRADIDHRQHHTQLLAIEEVLLGVLRALESQKVADGGAQVSETYDNCRKLAQATVWLERLWDFIRTKFDQRFGDSPVARTLQAADEVVWSCYRQVMRELPADHPARARALLPLAYIEPEYSPAAVQSDQQVPTGLRLRSGNPVLDRCLEKLPLPTLRLPPWCISAPWSLVLVGHEMGHHVEHELGVTEAFAQAVGEAVAGAKLDDASSAAWTDWSEEIFADAFSILAMGPAAAIAITELEWTVERNLTQRKTYYPAPVIRLALMTRLIERQGLDTAGLVPLEQLRDIAARDPVAREDWKAIEPVLDVVCCPQLPGGLPSLGSLCGFHAARFESTGPVAIWSEGLRGIGSLSADRDTEDARHMASAALGAWLAVLAEAEDEKRQDQLGALSSRIPGAIRLCAEPGVRAGAGVDVSPTTAQEIASLLLDAPISNGERGSR